MADSASAPEISRSRTAGRLIGTAAIAGGAAFGAISGTKIGMVVGGTVGGAIGSVVPVLGTAIGAGIGVWAGGAVGAAVGTLGGATFGGGGAKIGAKMLTGAGKLGPRALGSASRVAERIMGRGFLRQEATNFAIASLTDVDHGLMEANHHLGFGVMNAAYDAAIGSVEIAAVAGMQLLSGEKPSVGEFAAERYAEALSLSVVTRAVTDGVDGIKAHYTEGIPEPVNALGWSIVGHHTQGPGRRGAGTLLAGVARGLERATGKEVGEQAGRAAGKEAGEQAGRQGGGNAAKGTTRKADAALAPIAVVGRCLAKTSQGLRTGWRNRARGRSGLGPKEAGRSTGRRPAPPPRTPATLPRPAAPRTAAPGLRPRPRWQRVRRTVGAGALRAGGFAGRAAGLTIRLTGYLLGALAQAIPGYRRLAPAAVGRMTRKLERDRQPDGPGLARSRDGLAVHSDGTPTMASQRVREQRHAEASERWNKRQAEISRQLGQDERHERRARDSGRGR